MKKRILVVTDCTDIAANELHATLVTNLDKLGADGIIVEPIIGAKEFSVINGSFLTRLIAESYDPTTAVILAVLNPLTTSDGARARIAGRLKNGLTFVGANTGIFSKIIDDFGLEEICETDNTGLKGDNFISFGGKYIHAPIAAKFASTDDLNSVKLADFNMNRFVRCDYEPGMVLHIDNFGVSKVHITNFEANENDLFELFINDEYRQDITFCYSMKALTNGTLAFYKGSSLGYFEIGIVRELESAKKIGLEIGDVVDIRRKITTS